MELGAWVVRVCDFSCLTPAFPYVPHTSIVFVGGLVSKAKRTHQLFSCAHIAVDKLLSPLRAFPSIRKAKNVLYEFCR